MRDVKYRHAGFTLLELLAVMAIVALLSTLAVTSYFGAVRGMARRSANEHFLNALTQARQRACIDGNRVSVVAFNEPIGYDDSGRLNKILPSYVVCREIGRISFVTGNYLFDEYADLKQLFGTSSGSTDIYSAGYSGGVRLYNLNKGFWTTVKSKVSLQQFGASQTTLWATTHPSYDDYTFEDYAFEISSGSQASSSGAQNWEVGDAYGIEVAPPINLPKTFYFKELEHRAESSSALTDILYVTFAADGRSVDKKDGGRSVTFTIESSDKIMGSTRYSINAQGMISN